MSYKNHYIYPVVVEKAEDGGLGMYFPDFPGTAIMARDLIDGMKRAKEMLAERLLDVEATGQEVPKPSEPNAIELLDADDRVIFIELYMPPYRDEEANKSVTKNCTLPKWLKEAGEEAGLNFSQLLQTAIKRQLGIPLAPEQESSSIN
ncbi:type II toxin-antitoxin system HicB family antitoxin [Brevibacillus sp. NRS-1366]|uniref:type II toxin-antitoxin system HicB family antitoxin n=1 Tax=Brevibacillus sp. NRS-1366 TaxID=3233899 RepID=UPI003D1E1CED